MKTPKISVIMPVYNAEKFLPETIASLQAQTFEDFEVICVDHGSTDGSVAVLEAGAKKDGRFIILHQENSGAGAARNYGFSNARGEYTIFVGACDLFSPMLLEKLHGIAAANQADVAACNFGKRHPDGRVMQLKGVYTQWIPGGQSVFSYRDCPDYIMRVIDPIPCNKLYRSEFIRLKGLKFEELFYENEITFSAVSIAAAERVAYITDSLAQYRIGCTCGTDVTEADKLKNISVAIHSAARQVSELPHGRLLQNAILSFVVGNYISSLTREIKDFSALDAAQFYQRVHTIFNHEAFAGVDAKTLHNPKQYREFCTVRKHDYETMRRLISRRMIVSLTTYPRRIGSIATVLESIYSQTRPADEVVLWLADSQFPGREADLPENLLKLVEENRLTIRWCDDLKPHKKYFYALQEYTEDVVVTVDDDLLYPKDMLEALHASYLLYPDAISTVRAHLILVSEQKEIMPYGTWIQETDTCIYQPSMQLLATGGAGCLYPPNLLRRELFDKEAIMEYCPWADDLWLKAMELMSDVPVVLARPFEQLHYLPNSQEEALHLLNVRQNYNDIQLEKIEKWLDEKYEPGILVKKLTESDIGVKILGLEAVSHHLDEERKALRRSWSQADQKIRQSNEKTRETENQLKQMQIRLHRLEADGASIGGQYQAVGKLLKAQKSGSGAGWYVKYFIYLLAWIPEKLLLAMLFYLKNGGKATVDLILSKFRK